MHLYCFQRKKEKADYLFPLAALSSHCLCFSSHFWNVTVTHLEAKLWLHIHDFKRRVSILTSNKQLCIQMHGSQKTAIMNTGSLPSVALYLLITFFTHWRKTSTNPFACFISHVSYNDRGPHGRFQQAKLTVCLGKPTRAAACETKQLSLLCPFFFLWLLGKVASKFVIKMAARNIVFWASQSIWRILAAV